MADDHAGRTRRTLIASPPVQRHRRGRAGADRPRVADLPPRRQEARARRREV